MGVSRYYAKYHRNSPNRICEYRFGTDSSISFSTNLVPVLTSRQGCRKRSSHGLRSTYMRTGVRLNLVPQGDFSENALDFRTIGIIRT